MELQLKTKANRFHIPNVIVSHMEIAHTYLSSICRLCPNSAIPGPYCMYQKRLCLKCYGVHFDFFLPAYIRSRLTKDPCNCCVLGPSVHKIPEFIKFINTIIQITIQCLLH